MAAKTASLSVNIIADAAKAKAGLREAETAFEKFRREVGQSQGAMGKFQTSSAAAMNFVKANAVNFATAAGAAMVAFGVSSVKAASRLEESINAVKVTFGVASQSILDFSKDAATTVGMAASEFNGFAVQFAGFATKVGKSSTDVSDIIKKLAVRTADFASVMNIDVAEAGRVFQSALAGETEPIKKFGIDMSAAAVEAYALANGLANSRSEITESVKQAARYGLLLQETNKVAGDFENTQDSLANGTRKLKAQFEDLQANVGGKLTPALGDLVASMNDLFGVFEKTSSFDIFGVSVGDIASTVFKFGTNSGLAAYNVGKLLFGVEETTPKVSDLGYATAEVNRAMTLAERPMARITEELKKLDAAAAFALASWNNFKNGLEFENEFAELQEKTQDFSAYWAEAMKKGTANTVEVQTALRNNKIELMNFAEQVLITASVADRNRILIKIDTGEIQTAIQLMNELLRTANVAYAMQGKVQYAATPFGGTPVAQQAGVYVDGVYIPPGIDFSKLKKRARGGIVTNPEVAMIGEAGAEAVIPLTKPARAMELMQQSGLDMLALGSMRGSNGGGNTYITVQAGLVSSPDQVGQQIIEAIRRAERRSGQVFASV